MPHRHGRGSRSRLHRVGRRRRRSRSLPNAEGSHARLAGCAMSAPLDYDGIRVLAEELGRPVHTLIALAPDNDPFNLQPSRRAKAMWFADLWKRLGAGAGMHLRRFHYQVVSQATPVAKV